MPSSQRLSKLVYVASMVAASTAGAAKAFVFAKVLPKSGYGYYSIAFIAANYLTYLIGVGVPEGFMREGATAWGKRFFQQISRMRNTSMVFVLLPALVVTLLVYGLVFVIEREVPFERALLMGALLATAILQYNIAATFLRVTERFVRYGLFLLGRNGAVAAFGGYLGFRYGFYQVVVGETVINVVLALLVLLLVRQKAEGEQPAVPAATSAETLRPVIHTGLPLAGNNFLKGLTLNLDRWFVAIALGATAMGEYSFAMLTMSLALSLLNIMMLSLGPRWISLYAKEEDLQALYRRVLQVVKLITLVATAIFVPLVFALPTLLELFYAKYTETFALILIVYGGATLHVANQFEWVFIATANGLVLIKIALASLIFVLALCVVGATLQQGLTFYAVAFVAGRALSLGLTFSRARGFAKHA